VSAHARVRRRVVAVGSKRTLARGQEEGKDVAESDAPSRNSSAPPVRCVTAHWDAGYRPGQAYRKRSTRDRAQRAPAERPGMGNSESGRYGWERSARDGSGAGTSGARPGGSERSELDRIGGGSDGSERSETGRDAARQSGAGGTGTRVSGADVA